MALSRQPIRSPKNQFMVIKLGGSLVAPANEKLAVDYVRAFARRAIGFLKQHPRRKLLIVVGGGGLSRVYQQAARAFSVADRRRLDRLGIYATYLNAELVRQSFHERACPKILTAVSAAAVAGARTAIWVSGGWRPGWSTDYVTAAWALTLGVGRFIIASNVDYIYDRDIARYPTARPLKTLTWPQYQKLMPAEFVPGAHVPIDRVAARVSQKNDLSVRFLNGSHLETLFAALGNKPFQGTTIG